MSYLIDVCKNKMDYLQLRELKHLLQQIFANHEHPFQLLSHIIDGDLNDLHSNSNIICGNEQCWLAHMSRDFIWCVAVFFGLRMFITHEDIGVSLQ